VVVDCRKDSDTYTLYESFNINEDNQISILIPPRLGNAYYVNSANAVYHYKLAYDGEYIDADKQFSYKWNDPLFNIKWPIEHPILSKRDAK
jgi:dTDP-4-dehydrorhamnose 3,5-epimerase